MRNEDFAKFRACIVDAPDGTHEQAKKLSYVLGETCDRLMEEIRSLGLKANNCDLIYALEAAMYDYVKKSNPDATVFPLAEGFGEHVNGPARERILSQTKRDRDFFASVMGQSPAHTE